MSEVTSSQNVNSSNNVTGGGVDYDSGPYTVTIPAGDIRMSFNVPINDDDVSENNEQFDLTIDTVPSFVTLTNPRQTTVTIVDNDRK